MWEDDDRDGEGWGDLEPSDNWGCGWGHRAVEKGGLSAKERNRGQNARTEEPTRPSGDWWAGRSVPSSCVGSLARTRLTEGQRLKGLVSSQKKKKAQKSRYDPLNDIASGSPWLANVRTR